MPHFALLSIFALATIFAVATGTAHASFATWSESELWPAARTAGITRAAFDTAMRGITPDTSIPNLKGASDKRQRQSEFRPPARYFNQKSLHSLARKGAALSRQHERALSRIEKRYGVPRGILLAIWARETAYGAAKLPRTPSGFSPRSPMPAADPRSFAPNSSPPCA